MRGSPLDRAARSPWCPERHPERLKLDSIHSVIDALFGLSPLSLFVLFSRLLFVDSLFEFHSFFAYCACLSFLALSLFVSPPWSVANILFDLSVIFEPLLTFSFSFCSSSSSPAHACISHFPPLSLLPARCPPRRYEEPGLPAVGGIWSGRGTPYGVPVVRSMPFVDLCVGFFPRVSSLSFAAVSHHKPMLLPIGPST